MSLVVVVAACGARPDEAPAIPPATAQAAEPSGPPRPAPGLDLDGPIAVPDPDGTPRRGGRVVELMADRAVVTVNAPTPPRGGAVQFTFAGGRDGWVTRIPDSRQLPSVAYAHDKIYVSGGFESVSFYALSARTGEVAWATSHLEDNGPTAAVIDGDDVLFNTESCTLFSLDAHTGKRNWLRWLGDPTLAQIAVTEGLVYAAHPVDDRDGAQRLSAYNVKTGAPVWSTHIGTELLATPVIAGDSVYVSTLGGTTYRIDHRTGAVRWKRRLQATTAPWIAADELFVSRRVKGKEQQIVVSIETGAIVREHAMSTGRYASDVPSDLHDWKSVWAFEGSRPVVERGIRYVAMGNEVHASDATTGEALWTRRYPVAADRRSLGSVALAGAALVVSSRDGKVFGLDVDTGYTLWSYDVGRTIAAEPVIAKGWLYVTTVDGYVIALDVADPSFDGWHMFGGNAHKNGPVVAPTAPAKEGGTTTADTSAGGRTVATTEDVAAGGTSATRAHVSDQVLRERYYRQQQETMAAAADHARARADAAHAAELARDHADKAKRAKQDAAEEAAARARKREPVKISDECWKNPLC